MGGWVWPCWAGEGLEIPPARVPPCWNDRATRKARSVEFGNGERAPAGHQDVPRSARSIRSSKSRALSRESGAVLKSRGSHGCRLARLPAWGQKTERLQTATRLTNFPLLRFVRARFPVFAPRRCMSSRITIWLSRASVKIDGKHSCYLPAGNGRKRRRCFT